MLSERAVLLDINLNHQVTRNPDVATAGDSAVIMSRGVLEPVGTKIILQIIRASLRAAHEETVEVCIFHYFGFQSDSCKEYSPGSAFVVKSSPHECHSCVWDYHQVRLYVVDCICMGGDEECI